MIAQANNFLQWLIIILNAFFQWLNLDIPEPHFMAMVLHTNVTHFRPAIFRVFGKFAGFDQSFPFLRPDFVLNGFAPI